MAWFRMMGLESVEYHRRTVLDGADDHPGAAHRYYGSRGETPLRWGGSLATRLGLHGGVDDDSYEAVFGSGGAVEPQSRVPLVRTRRPGVELVVSAHKSVAVLGVLGAVDHMHAIVDAETEATMAFLDAWFRRQGGRRGRTQTRTPTGGLLWARTRHLTSRAGDPEPHDHVLVANLTEMADARGGWKALDTAGLRDLVHAATMVGRLAAAETAVRLGYAIEADPGPSGKLGHWRLAGIPDEVLELFSKRTADIDAAVAAEGFDTPRARNVAARTTRAAKSDGEPGDLWEQWRAEVETVGVTAERLRRHFEKIQRRHRRPLRALSDRDRAALVDRIVATDGPLAELKAFTRADVIRIAAPHLYGCPGTELNGVVRDVIAHHEAVPLVGQPGARSKAWALASVLAFEDQLADVAGRLTDLRGREPLSARLVEDVIEYCELHAGYQMTPGQRDAVFGACTSGRGLDVIVGVAGSGKTTALEAIHLAHHHTGHRVLGTAISGQASRTLGTDTGIDCRTVASLLARLDNHTIALDRKTVVVIDEAGMADDRALLRLLDVVDHAGAKAVVVGDHRQLGAIGPGGGLEAVIDRHPDAVHVLDENVRQVDRDERGALEHLRAGDIDQAVAWYVDHDRIVTRPTRSDAIDAAVAAWHADVIAGRSSVLLAWRRADVAALNHAARQARIADGTITGPTVTAPGGRPYAAGDHVVMLTPGQRGAHVTSERATVAAVDHDRLLVRFDDDRSATLTGPQVEADHLDHAYALTVHRMQGATVDRAHVLADGGGRELAYVAMSRAREATHVHVVADDADQAADDLRRGWSIERRQRWITDTETPAIGPSRQGPALAPRCTNLSREANSTSAPPVQTEHPRSDHVAPVEAITRRLDAIQHRQETPEHGLGL